MKIQIKLSKPTRQLISASIYFACALFAIINLGLTGATLNSVDLILTVIGIITWSIASTQGLIIKFLARRSALKQTLNNDIELGITPGAPENSAQLTHSNDRGCIRRSTYSTISSALNMISSACFFASDMHNIQSADAQLVARLFGSALWFKSASLYCWMSRSYERKQEDDPTLAITHCGLEANDINLIGNVEYLASAIYYAGSIWSSNPIPPLKAAGNICWIIAGAHDTISAYRDIRNEPQLETERTTIPRTMTLFPAPIANSSPTPKDNSLRVAPQGI